MWRGEIKVGWVEEGGDDVCGWGFGKVMFKLDVRGRGMGCKRVV